MSVIQYVMFLALVGLATFCQNLTGFAFGLIFVGVAGATHLMGIGDAANVACLLSVVNGVAYLRAHRQVPQWTLLKPMLISSVIGVIGGVLLLQWLSGNALSGLRILLGLAIVAAVVRQHGGSIVCDDADDGPGLCMRVSFPGGTAPH